MAPKGKAADKGKSKPKEAGDEKGGAKVKGAQVRSSLRATIFLLDN